MHAWELAGGEIDLNAHSALVAVGGDGTLHEVINGMLMRQDQARIPISFVPNGSGNDLVGCLGIRDVNQALDWLIKGDVIKMDVNKVLLDHEDEIEIPAEQRNAKFRYSVINAAVGFIAKITHLAVKHKKYMGKGCYISSATVNFFTSSSENFDIEIEKADGDKIALTNEETMYLVVMNGKFGGGRVVLCPSAILNDGLLDVCMQHGPAGTRQLASFIKHAIAKKGAHIYKDNYSCFRGKAIKIINRNLAAVEIEGGEEPAIEPQKF